MSWFFFLETVLGFNYCADFGCLGFETVLGFNYCADFVWALFNFLSFIEISVTKKGFDLLNNFHRRNKVINIEAKRNKTRI